MPIVYTTFQPWQPVFVDDDEAAVLAAQGLLAPEPPQPETEPETAAEPQPSPRPKARPAPAAPSDGPQDETGSTDMTKSEG